MPYLAVLQTDNYEYMCLGSSPIKAKLGVFDGFNTFVKKLLEMEYANPLQEVTSEWLASRLEKYYRHHIDGNVSIESLEKKWSFTVLEIEYDKCYRDGSETPRREQDY